MTLPAITTALADAYFALTPRNALWTAVTDKQIQLGEAQKWLGALCFDQRRDCCGRSFDAAWTEAVSELALALHQSPTALIGGGAVSGGATGEVKRQQLGDLSVEYFQSRAGEAVVQTSRYGPNDPLVLQRFPWLHDVLSCWLPSYGGGNSRVIARVRS